MRLGKARRAVQQAVVPQRTKYQVLRCAPTATMEELRAAFLRLAADLAPDKLLAASAAARKRHAQCAFGGAQAQQGCAVCLRTVQFAEVTEAYATLKDAARRRQYDQELALRRRPCSKCKGTGKVAQMAGKGFAVQKIKCPQCAGTGEETVQ